MNTQSMHRRPRKGGDEVDAFSRNHAIHGYRPGQGAAITTRHNRRVRREVSESLRTGREV